MWFVGANTLVAYAQRAELLAQGRALEVRAKVVGIGNVSVFKSDFISHDF